MAIPFKSPKPRHRYTVAKETAALDALFTRRNVPERSPDRLLMASWNVANLGAQGRTKAALRVIAHMLKRFELIALQELNEEYRALIRILDFMGPDFDFIMSDTAGNNERMAFVFDRRKVRPMKLFGELALRPREYPKRTVKVRYTDGGVEKIDTFRNFRFTPFDRNPYIGTFRAGAIDFTLANVHLYFGRFGNSKKKKDRERYARRILEIFALSKWADRRVNRKATYDRDIVLLGDMNVPAMTAGDPAFGALTDFGFQPLDYPSQVGGSNLGNDKTYDQMAFAPGSIETRIRDHAVFDFDNAIFSRLWDKLSAELPKSRAISRFRAHVKHHISDHRPLWVSLDIT